MLLANTISNFAKKIVLVSFVITTFVVPSFAQEISDEHIGVAKSAMVATGATAQLDRILPEGAAFTKTGLIANRPDIEAEITQIVNEVAISLAARRGPLEDEVALIYAKEFSSEELKQIETFFGSEAGKKFLTRTPVLFRQVDEVSRVWRTGITRDMGQIVGQKLQEQGLQ